jgi:hypothetical protein
MARVRSHTRAVRWIWRRQKQVQTHRLMSLVFGDIQPLSTQRNHRGASHNHYMTLDWGQRRRHLLSAIRVAKPHLGTESTRQNSRNSRVRNSLPQRIKPTPSSETHCRKAPTRSRSLHRQKVRRKLTRQKSYDHQNSLTSLKRTPVNTTLITAFPLSVHVPFRKPGNHTTPYRTPKAPRKPVVAHDNA